MAKKTSIGSLLLAGAAAYGLYKLSKMNSQQRQELLDKGKHLVADQWGNLQQVFGSNGSSPDARINNLSGDVTFGG